MRASASATPWSPRPARCSLPAAARAGGRCRYCRRITSCWRGATQLVPDLPAAFSLLKPKYGAGYPSMISFITGPSRTGDIERILVLGAHGPKKLTILCL